jgi:hypothetical protein
MSGATSFFFFLGCPSLRPSRAQNLLAASTAIPFSRADSMTRGVYFTFADYQLGRFHGHFCVPDAHPAPATDQGIRPWRIVWRWFYRFSHFPSQPNRLGDGAETTDCSLKHLLECAKWSRFQTKRISELVFLKGFSSISSNCFLPVIRIPDNDKNHAKA